MIALKIPSKKCSMAVQGKVKVTLSFSLGATLLLNWGDLRNTVEGATQ
jgi:hypothetical protein